MTETPVPPVVAMAVPERLAPDPKKAEPPLAETVSKPPVTLPWPWAERSSAVTSETAIRAVPLKKAASPAAMPTVASTSRRRSAVTPASAKTSPVPSQFTRVPVVELLARSVAPETVIATALTPTMPAPPREAATPW